MGMGSPDTRPPWADDSCWVGLLKPRRGGSMSITRRWRVFCCPEIFGWGNEVTALTKPNYSLREIPGAIWAPGSVSMLMDVSSEMIHALLPVYLVTVLGTSTVPVGVIEGIAEATGSITKIFSGALSDWLGERKLLAVLGYGPAAFTEPVFPLALALGGLLTVRGSNQARGY